MFQEPSVTMSISGITVAEADAVSSMRLANYTRIIPCDETSSRGYSFDMVLVIASPSNYTRSLDDTVRAVTATSSMSRVYTLDF